MQGLNKQDVLAFHRRWYHPNNAVLVVSGDITAKELRPLVEKYYGNIPRGKLPPRSWTDEPPQNNARRLTLEHRNVKQPQWKRTYMAPSLGYGKKDDALPLLVFSQLLGGSKSSLLYQSIVVEQKLASAITASYNAFAIGPGELSISATPEKDISLATLEAAIDKELAKWRAELPEASHIGRAKTRLKADAIYARDGLTGMARIMGWMVMIGLPVDYFSRWPTLIEAVTPEQMRAAAQNVLKPEQSVTGVLLPAAASEAKENAGTQEGKGA